MGASAGAIRAGRAFVEIGGDDSPLLRTLDGAASRLRQFAAGAAKVAVGLTLGRLAEGGIQKVAGLFGDVAGRASAMDLLAKKLGTTTEEVSALAYAFEQQGVGFEQFQGTLEGLATSLSSAADGADDSFRRIGLNARALIRLPLPDALEMIVDRLKDVTLAEDRVRIANELGLGSLLPIVKKGAAGLRELKAEAARAGAVVTPEQAERGRAVMMQYTKTWQALKYAVLEAGMNLLPSAERIREVGDVARAMVNGLRGLGTAVREWAAGIAESVANVSTTFRTLAGVADETWGGVVAAVRKGDLELAFKVAAAGTKAVWFEMLAAMSSAFSKWIEDHRDKLVLLGGLLGGLKGGAVGGRFGPWGALIGAGLGAGAGGLAADQAAGLLKGFANNPGLERAARDARKELSGLVGKAMAPGGGPGGVPDPIAEFKKKSEEEERKRLAAMGPQLFNSVKGTFALPAAQQQLGYGDQSRRAVINGLDKIGKAAEVLPDILRAVDELNKRLGLK